MSNPLGDATRRRLTDAAAGRLAADGFEITRPESRAEPPAIAVRAERVADATGVSASTGTVEATEPLGDVDGDAFGIEPLASSDVTPTTVVSRIAHALERDRRALFVVADEAAATRLESILGDPPLVVAERDGRRTFHAGPDRIPVDTTSLRVDTGGYACVQVAELGGSGGSGGFGGSDPTFRWRETDTPVGPVAAVDGVDPAAVDDGGRPTVPRLVCEVADEVLVVLAGVESLRTPPSEAFPYFYRRDATDKRFRVRRGDDGTVVESVSGFAAMRAAGFVPVPMPLVPEHAIGAGPGGDGQREVAAETLHAAWAVLVVDRVAE